MNCAIISYSSKGNKPHTMHLAIPNMREFRKKLKRWEALGVKCKIVDIYNDKPNTQSNDNFDRKERNNRNEW